MIYGYVHTIIIELYSEVSIDSNNIINKTTIRHKNERHHNNNNTVVNKQEN